MTLEYKLTPAQDRLLNKVRDRGEVRCNGRREKTVRALADKNLVTFTLEVVPDCKRGTALFFVVKPVQPVFQRYRGPQ